MSDHRALAALTQTLRTLLAGLISGPVPGATVTTGPPTATAGSAQDTPRANLFLYRTTVNSAWRNSDVFTDRPGPGQPSPPPVDRRVVLPLDAHYLLSFHGSESQLVPQQLLGVAAAFLKDNPRLSALDITAALGPSEPLSDTGLDQDVAQVEPVLLKPEELDMKDLSRLWMMFPQVPYSLALTFQASVVLLQPVPALPSPLVRDVAITATPGLGASPITP